MGKYDPLKAFLVASNADEVAMQFEEIEKLLGTRLPSSKKYAAWWSNNPSNNTMTRVWLEAGYRTERLDIESRKVIFRRAPDPSLGSPGAGRDTRNVVDRLQAALGGTVRIAPGVDLTDPTGEVWDAEHQ